MKWRTFLPIGVLILTPLWAAPDPQTKLDLAGRAAGVVSEAEQARQAVTARDKQTALMHVQGALGLVSDIEARAASHAAPLVVPMSSETDTVTVYRPVKRGHSDELSARRMKKRTSIREVSGDFHQETLNVTSARDHLESARTALNNEDFTAADAALAAVHNDVTTKTLSGDMPLMKAKENLALARARVSEGKYKAAVAPLRSASEALGDYQRSAAGPETAEVGSLRQQIDDYTRRIAHDHADAVDRIETWSNQVDRWMQSMTR